MEHENVGTEGAHQTEIVGEAVLRHGTRFAQKQIREHPQKTVHKAESKHIKATADYQYRATVQEHPEMKGNAVSRYWQKQRLKKQYAKQAREAAKLKELEQRKIEAENSEIVDMVRGMSVSLTELPLLLEKLRSGETLGQVVPKSGAAEMEDN